MTYAHYDAGEDASAIRFDLAVQFLGACNDNVLKQILALQVVKGVWRGVLGVGAQGIVTVIFTVPFIVFSGWSGAISDNSGNLDIEIYVLSFRF